jgi:hypothetical protein
MIAIPRVAARRIARTGRQIATALTLAGVLAVLTACAAGSATSSLAAPATASTPAAPSATAAAPAPAKHLTATEINERCWMSTEKYKAGDIDKRMKLVDKCVDEMTRAQGGV